MLSKRRPLSVEKVLMKGKSHTRALMICDYGDIVVANSHFPLTGETRLMAAESVRKELNKWVKVKPVFFMGDLNALPDSPEMALLKKDFTVISDENTPTWSAGRMQIGSGSSQGAPLRRPTPQITLLLWLMLKSSRRPVCPARPDDMCCA